MIVNARNITTELEDDVDFQIGHFETGSYLRVIDGTKIPLLNISSIPPAKLKLLQKRINQTLSQGVLSDPISRRPNPVRVNCIKCNKNTIHTVAVLTIPASFNQLIKIKDVYCCNECNAARSENEHEYECLDSGKTYEYKIHTIEELNQMKIGTCLVHQTLGKCILLRKNGKMRLQFKTSNDFDVREGYPFDIPMRLL